MASVAALGQLARGSRAMPQNLKSLTALRFFAAIWVVSFHYWPSLGLPMPALVAKGYLGVELFFVLSGFILSHVYLQRFGERRFSYRGFLWARLARIYPVHLATLAGVGLLVAVATFAGVESGGKILIWASLPAHLTLTQAWGLGQQGGWNHPSWSISAEWFAYLAFPVFAWLSWRLRHRPVLATMSAILLVAALETGFQSLAGFPLTRATIAWGALRIVPCFALGCAIHLLWSARPLPSTASAIASSAATLCAVVLTALLNMPDWLPIALFGSLIFSLASLSGAGSGVLTAPLWVYLGEVSFSLYMVCIPWQLVFEKAVHRLPGVGGGPLQPLAWLAEFVGVIPIAMAVHHLVERPAREAMRRSGAPFTKRQGHVPVSARALVVSGS